MNFKDLGAIREANENDIEAIKRVSDESIGHDYYSEADIKDIINKKGHYIFVYPDENDTPIAFMYIFTEKYSDARKKLHLEGDEYSIEGISEDMPVGVYKTACTSREYRRSGILGMFANLLEVVFEEDNAECILFTGIKLPDGKVPVDTVARSVGFEPLFEVIHPWIGIESPCPYCGKDRCICDAVVYKKDLRK